MATPGRLHRGIVALSASAIAAVYMGGYLRTQAADASIGASAAVAAQSTAIVATAAPPLVAPTIVPGAARTPASGAATVQPATAAPSSARAAPTRGAAASSASNAAGASAASSAASATAAAVGTYKDGTYTGQGSSRRGGVTVSVVVQGAQIASVTITQSSLQYPLRDIAGLPAQVVQRQSAQVDTVSRATYSSQAFRGAVTQALSKAS